MVRNALLLVEHLLSLLSLPFDRMAEQVRNEVSLSISMRVRTPNEKNASVVATALLILNAYHKQHIMQWPLSP